MKYKTNILRELKDYFCTYRQTKQLMALGIIGVEHLKHITPSNEILNQLSESCLGAILRSQALDYFRELGYNAKVNQSKNGCWHEIEKGNILITEGGFWHYYNSESALIDKLIELEKEARNG